MTLIGALPTQIEPLACSEHVFISSRISSYIKARQLTIFGPPGYTIPQRYMNRTPPPDGADTNTRPYLIFFSYMLTCFSVSVFIIQRIVKKNTVLKKSTILTPPPRKQVWLFSALAAGSLLTTWGFMIQYFNVSYKTWLMWRSYYELDPHHRHWGLWLRETSLFHEAWELVVVGNARYWWSHQIFFFALGLGIYMEQRGVRRNIKYTWAFMLLGQIVAISFATNLFLLTLILSPPTPSVSSTRPQRSSWISPWLLNLASVLATTIPAYLLADEHYWYHSTDFMPVLLIPHVALLVTPFARALVPENWFPENDLAFEDKVFGYMWALTLGNAALMMLKTTYAAVSYGGFVGIQNALLEHPAVSSVGFDVIFCWITWICWYITRGEDVGSFTKEPIKRL
ncbi:hypothetical protein HBH56_026400 [Parastagonospora nodorum]|nr:hypothetical protein HBH56_026400 [Parastagonospora nodorum]KAH4141649.1 hypothetical protein HBH45_061140 [Parastagonospora nodorum]KAH4161642.1 hypothetical protein HBH44_094730 [Parastagonospora nodorum]KAH4175719.1 hypothetical protein HBH43_066030 [Parastagonospora nodorum]KAH4407970.1 hypothetical protein HBH92_150880 [Parastagonospora nodorum]